MGINVAHLNYTTLLQIFALIFTVTVILWKLHFLFFFSLISKEIHKMVDNGSIWRQIIGTSSAFVKEAV